MLKLDGLEKLREEGLKSLWPPQTKLVVGLASCGLAAGAGQIYYVLEEEKGPHGLIGQTGCLWDFVAASLWLKCVFRMGSGFFTVK